jgi:membrane protease YdiL (CAAX protease family)
MNEINPRRLRLIELLLVVLIPLLPSLVSSIYIFVNHQYFESGASSSGSSNYNLLLHSTKQLSGIAILFYVLFRQGRKAEDIGFSFRWIDLLLGIGIYAAVNLLYYSLAKWMHFQFPHMDVKAYNLGSTTSGTFGVAFIFMFINPFYEELIVRAYAMTEIEFLSGSKIAAIVISTLFQSSYHLYQGLFPALMTIPIFLIYSLYFSRYKKIMPVIIAHLIVDMAALVWHHR